MTEELTLQIEKLKSYNEKIVQMFAFSVSGEAGHLYEFDLYYAGTANRAVAIINSFSSLITTEPLGAIALVRIHLDTFLRANAIAVAEDRLNFVKEVRAGTMIQKIKMDSQTASNLGLGKGATLLDSNLVKVVKDWAPKIETLYKGYSGDIHFSAKAIEKAVTQDSSGISFSIGTNELFTDEDKMEAVQDMIYISEMVLSSLSAYIVHKSKPDEEAPVPA